MAASEAESAPQQRRAASAALFYRRHHQHRRRELGVGLVGLVFVAGGAVLQFVALVSAPWLDGVDSRSTRIRLGFGGFADRTQRGFAHVYFVWGAWVLFALMLAVGIVACVRWRRARIFGILGALIGVVSAFATIGGVLVFAYQTDSEVFHIARNYSEGAYIATLGSLASAFGAAAGGVGA